MFNPNHLWPSTTPLVPQTMGYSHQMSLNAMFLPTNQQNFNHLYYNQNPNQSQNFGQHFNQYNNDFNYYRPLLHTQNHPLQAHPSPMCPPIDTNWLTHLNPLQRQALDQLNKEQEEFEMQFKNWEKDFENWKQLNQTHPDRNAYQLYVNQWQQWRQRLVDRKDQMKELRQKTLQQLYSQVQQQPNHFQPNPPPPPPPPTEKPKPKPPPPPTPTDKAIPQSTSRKESTNSCKTSSLLSPTKILEIHKNLNEKQNKFNVNLEEIKDIKSNEKTESNERHKQKTDKPDIEVIELDVEDDNQKDIESNSAANDDQMAKDDSVSQMTKDFIFIQKQQELLKSLESLKKVNTNELSNDLEIIESKPFDIKDIVTKMKAIRPPEHIDHNQHVSQLPSLQGIVFRDEPKLETNRPQIGLDVQNQSFGQRFSAHNNHLSAPDYRQPFLMDSTKRQEFPIETIRPPFQTMPELKNERDYSFYRINDNVSKHLPPNTVRKYSAQTIDYNHRHEERRDFETRKDTSNQNNFSRKPMESFGNNLILNNDIRRDLKIQTENQLNNSLQKDNPIVEQSISYTDLRYFTQPKSGVIDINDLLNPPIRHYRPENIAIIFRGLPGSGKSYIAKLIKEKEVEFNGSAPRILSIDDYFMTETERETKDPETRKTITIKEFVYEYEREMELNYSANLLKSFRRTVDDRLFPFIIVDAVNELSKEVKEYYNYAINKGFVVYIIELDSIDPNVCHKNNIHQRNLDEIKQIHKRWQKLPKNMPRIDIGSLLQSVSIKEMKMDSNSTKCDENFKRKYENDFELSEKRLKCLNTNTIDDNLDNLTEISMTRWERMEASEAKLDKLDSYKLKIKSQTIEEYLEVTEDYEHRGQKRVRWADIEEKKKQDRMRDMGYVVGQNWHQLTDPQHCERALTQTKYF